ncbi:MAG TPA: FAD-dependent oxidoreductase [Tepidisphaeraceae bacterium]|jgi:protoporphyrinogen oxidase
MSKQQIILGGGVTGLAAGVAGAGTVYEATPHPGGICSSYYVSPGAAERLHEAPKDGEAYRFEIGGGHWIFGGDPAVLRFIKSLTPTQSYSRRSSVYLPDEKIYTPFPIQNHLRALGAERANRALNEMTHPSGEQSTMKDWLRRNFGATLFDLFFDGFNRLYTAGMYDRVAPQDAYKSPVDLAVVAGGVTSDAPAVGYNTQYLYPAEGLGTLAQRMAAKCKVAYGKRAVRIDPKAREVHFADGSSVGYSRLISTLPLDAMLKLTGMATVDKPDPYTSVLVVNIGAKKGGKCPADHWVYVPKSAAGFHRVGFYSNVSPTFLPKSRQDHVSIYVESAYPGGARPSDPEIKKYCDALVRELREWDYIADVDVIDPTWIDSAYTWSWPESKWRGQALSLLEQSDIYQVGRYGRWIFQGIADSIRDGFIVGTSLK